MLQMYQVLSYLCVQSEEQCEHILAALGELASQLGHQLLRSVRLFAAVNISHQLSCMIYKSICRWRYLHQHSGINVFLFT